MPNPTQTLAAQPCAEPGWKPPLICRENTNGECHRQAVACVTGWHPFFIPWCDPRLSAGYSYWEWKELWVKALAKMGFNVEIVYDNEPVRNMIASGIVDDRYWIAAVNALSGNRSSSGSSSHAIVMYGDDFYWDCNEGAGNARTARPHSYQAAWVLMPK